MTKIFLGLALLISMPSFGQDCIVDLQIGGTIDEATKSEMVSALESLGYSPRNYYELTDAERNNIDKKVRMGASPNPRQIRGGAGLDYVLSEAAVQLFGRDTPIYADMSHNLGGETVTISKDFKYSPKSEARIYSDLKNMILATIPACE